MVIEDCCFRKRAPLCYCPIGKRIYSLNYGAVSFQKTFFPYDHEAFSFSYHEKLGHTAARDIFLFFCLDTSISRTVGAGRVDTFPQEGDIEHMTAHITVFDMFLVVYSTMFQKILFRGFLRYQNLKLRFYFLLFQLCSLHIYAGCVPYKNLCWENNHLFLQMRKIFKYIHWQRFNHVHKTKSRRGKMAASSARSASPLSLKMCGGRGHKNYTKYSHKLLHTKIMT